MAEEQALPAVTTTPIHRIPQTGDSPFPPSLHGGPPISYSHPTSLDRAKRTHTCDDVRAMALRAEGSS